jgi:hypothetical protein
VDSTGRKVYNALKPRCPLASCARPIHWVLCHLQSQSIKQSCVHARGDNRARPVCVKCTVHEPDYRRTPSLASIQDTSHPNLTFFDPTYRKENINVRPDHHWRVPPNQLCPNSSLFLVSIREWFEHPPNTNLPELGQHAEKRVIHLVRSVLVSSYPIVGVTRPL